MKRVLLFCLCLLLTGCIEAAVVGMAVNQQTQNANTNQTSKALTKLNHGIVFDDFWEYAAVGESRGNDKLRVVVKYVKSNSEASKAGFKVGDEIMTVNDEAPWDYNWNRFLMNGDNPVNYTMRRGAQEYKAQLNPI